MNCSTSELHRSFALALSSLLPWFGSVLIAAPEGANERQVTVNPLPTKQEMIRDRFKRLQDRMFQLRTDLAQAEPDSAARLEKAIERAGEMGLSDELERLIGLLNDPSALPNALDGQTKWVENADRLLSILLEQDGDNKEREKQIDLLEQYRRDLNKLLEQQKALRSASGRTAEAKRMLQQVNQAIRRAESLAQKQGNVSKQTGRESSSEKSSENAKSLGDQQEGLQREAQELGEDLKSLATPPEESSAEPSELQEARKQTAEAGESAKSGAQSMAKAAQAMQQSGGSKAKSSEKSDSGAPKAAEAQSPEEHQKAAEEALRRTIERLQEAKKALEPQTSSVKNSGEQKSTAKDTRTLSERMRQDSKSEGQSGSSGQQGQKSQSGKSSRNSPPPNAPQNLDKAEQEMEDAAESLEEEKPEDATEPQDRAIDQLEQVQRDLEEALLQLRKEEREEILRDLESRFREMLSKQVAVNDETIKMDLLGDENFRRPEQLQIADLATRQRALSEQAATCVHILDEEGTTVAFPHIVAQVAEDMGTAADRLVLLQVGPLTQTVQQEIVDALEQLLDAIKKMRQENEQQGRGGGGGSPPSEKNPPLLPPSAELKLLRSSQLRVNTRTSAIDAAREAGTESETAAVEGLRKAALRQLECADIAKQMRDRPDHH